jgi:dihydropteroate synthase
MPQIIITGIINCTPDSFSDGDPTATPQALVNRALALIDQGADAIDLGGDSTRPGSVCVSDEIEWSRISPLLKELAHRIPISIDTHKAEIARRSIENGAKIINDISGGTDPNLVAVVAREKIDYVCMFNANGAPHLFSSTSLQRTNHDLTKDNAIDTLTNWWHQITKNLTQNGTDPQRLILDTGLGAFLSPDPAVSSLVIDRYWEIAPLQTRRMFGCSRKGFLKKPNENSPLERDPLSAALGAEIIKNAPDSAQIYLRVHNVAAQVAALRATGG